MGAFANLSEFVNRVTGGNSGNPQAIFGFKAARNAGAAAAATLAGRNHSLWLYDGNPSGGAAPTTVAAPTNATAGSLKQTDPSGGRQLWLAGLGAASNAPGTLVLYDRLLHVGGLSGTSTGAQAVGGALTRYTSGPGNRIFVEIYTTIGVTSTTVTASYTNQASAGQTSQAVAIGNTGFREGNRLIELSLASGDTGVQGVTSVTLAASTTTAGNFGVIVAHELARVSIPDTGVMEWRSLLVEGMGPVEILAGACLMFGWIAQGSTAPELGELGAFMVER